MLHMAISEKKRDMEGMAQPAILVGRLLGNIGERERGVGEFFDGFYGGSGSERWAGG